MRWARRMAGRAASGVGVVGVLIAGVATCARIGRAVDRGSDGVRAVSRIGDVGSASRSASRVGRLGRAGRAAGSLDDFAEARRVLAIPGRHATPRQLEKVARIEGELRSSGWREGMDAIKTAKLIYDIASRFECAADAVERAGFVSSEEAHRVALLQSQNAELRVAALTIEPDTYLGERLLFAAGVALHDPEPEVRIAAAQLIGNRAPPVSPGATALSLAIDTEKDDAVRAAMREEDRKVSGRFREWLDERRSAQR